MRLINGIMNLYCSIFMSMILLITWNQRRLSSASTLNRRMMEIILSMTLSSCLGDLVFHDHALLLSLLSFVAVAAFYSAVGMYMFYVTAVLNLEQTPLIRGLKIVSVALCTLAFLLWGINCVTPWFYDMQASRILNDALYLIAGIPGTIVVFMNLVLVFVNRKKLSPLDTFLLMMMPLVPTAASFVSIQVEGLSLQYSLMFMVIALNHFRIDVELERELEKKEKEMHELRLQMQQERMQPHFVYNVLTSIYILCEKDPAQAQSALLTFTNFLRSTLDGMEMREKVPFSWELNLVQNYVQLEKLRFGNRLSVQYDIGEFDFMLPPFTVQPLVENAVKHGLRNAEGGEIHISVRGEEGGYVISVADNGSGFSPEVPKEGVSGLRNIQEILTLTRSGELIITSDPEIGGTLAMVRLRAEK